MNTENKLHEQLDALNKMNLDELRNLCRKYFPGMKHCRSKILLRKKISFMIQAKAWGCLDPSLQKLISELRLGQPRVKNNKGFITGTTFTRKLKDKTYHWVSYLYFYNTLCSKLAYWKTTNDFCKKRAHFIRYSFNNQIVKRCDFLSVYLYILICRI